MNSLPELRPYRDLNDLPALHQVLRRGMQAGSPAFYVHPGDLNWWLFYPPLKGDDLFKHLYLWEDPAHPGGLLGWVLLSPSGWNTFDVVLQPELYATQPMSALLEWAETNLYALTRPQAEAGKPVFLRCMWVSEEDVFRRDWLEKRGYVRHSADVHFVYDLSCLPDTPALPPGFTFRPVAALDQPAGPEESAQRAAAQKTSFGTEAPWEAYLERYRNLMRSPAYSQAMDLAIFAPDGRVAAFCLVWLDPESGRGNFEPVGTHPDFQRRGLGKALLHCALRQLHSLGYASAQVNTNADEIPAVRLYESAGFRLEQQLIVYKKLANPLPESVSDR